MNNRLNKGEPGVPPQSTQNYQPHLAFFSHGVLGTNDSDECELTSAKRYLPPSDPLGPSAFVHCPFRPMELHHWAFKSCDEAMLFSKLLRNGLTEMIIRLCMHYPRSPPLAWSTLKRRMNTHTNLTSLPMLRVTGLEHLSYPTLNGARKLANDRKWVCKLQRSIHVAESSQENPI